MAFCPDGRMVAAGGNRVEMWDITTMRKLATALDGQYSAISMMFSPDGKTLAVGTPSAGRVILWDLSKGKITASISYEGTYPDDEDPVSSLAFSPDGKTLAFGHLDDGEVVLWDVAGGKKATTILGRDSTRILSVAFSPDGKTVASGCNGGWIKLWDVITRKSVGILGGHVHPVNSVAFSPDGKFWHRATTPLCSGMWQCKKKSQLSMDIQPK